MSPSDDTELLRFCEKLVNLADDPETTSDELSRKFGEFLELSRLKVVDLAGLLNVSDQTIYRWLRGEGKPKATYMKRLRLLLDEKVEGHAPQPLRVVRIGLPPFWDTSLLAAFEPAFASHGLSPQFVSITGLVGGVHGGFRENRIDMAIHSQFLIRYDHELGQRKDDRYQGLVMRYPLFGFRGYYVYTRRKYVEALLAGLDGLQDKAEVRGGLQSLCSGRWFTMEPGQQKAALTYLLREAHIGVERGTGFDLAMRCTYQRGDFSFSRHQWINLRNDYPFPVPINGVGENPDVAETADAFRSFLEGTTDLFCGGLAQHHYLQSTTQMPGDVATGLGGGMREYLVLLRPSDLKLQSYRGIVTRTDFDPAVVETVAKIWYAGVSQMLKRARERTDADEDTRSLAMINLNAMQRTVDGYLPLELRLTGRKFIESAKWQAWVADVANSLKEITDQSLVADTLMKVASGSINFYQQDWRSRVEAWISLMVENCQFYSDFAEARRAYARRYNEWDEANAQILIDEMDEMAGGLADLSV